jgi:hypothetical protein
MSLVAVLLFGVGILLVYAAFSNQNPADVVKKALGGKGTIAPLSPEK